MLERFDNALLANDDILFFIENFNKVTFIATQLYILAVNPDKILMKVIILMKMILILLLMSELWLGMVNLKNAKQLKKDK